MKISLLAKGRHNIFVHGFKPTTKLKLVERSEALRVLTLLAVVASPRTGGVQGCRLAAAAEPEITPEPGPCTIAPSPPPVVSPPSPATHPPATSTVTMDLLWSSFRRRRGWVNKISTPKPHKGMGKIYIFIAGCDMKIFLVEGTLFCSAYHRLVPGEQDIFCDELNYQVCADFHN